MQGVCKASEIGDWRSLCLIHRILRLTLGSLFLIKTWPEHDFNKKTKEVFIKARSTSASRSLKGKDTKPTTVKWSIASVASLQSRHILECDP